MKRAFQVFLEKPWTFYKLIMNTRCLMHRKNEFGLYNFTTRFILGVKTQEVKVQHYGAF